MRISVVGSGYVGLVTAACLADSGNHVVGLDVDASKVKALSTGQSPIFEPGLDDLLRRNLAAGRLRFTTRFPEGLFGAQIVFIAVGTPANPDGTVDLAAVERVSGDIGRNLQGPAIVVTKSTVPVGTGALVESILRGLTPHHVDLVSNPEFLKEGSAVDDFLRPDRVVIGAENPEAGEILAELYKPFVRNNKPILRMSRAAAEMTKYAANAYLATRISFINEMAEICERLSVDIDEVRRGIGADARIGHHFLYPGLGYGGSCFPKDVQALTHTARKAGVTAEILDAVHRRNVRQRAHMTQRILKRLGAAPAGKKVAVWGLSFKPKTDDVRESPGVDIVQELSNAGVIVAVSDPHALDSARVILGDRVEYCTDEYAALTDADALLINTEWMEYRSPDFDRMRAMMRQPVIFDGRNIYDARMMSRHEFEYHSVGRPSVGVDT